VRTEVDLATPARGRSAGERLTRELAGNGYRVGPNGFVLRYTYEAFDTPQRFNMNVDDKEGIVIPMLTVKWEFLDDKSQSLWKAEGQFSFKHEQSRYYDKTRKKTLEEQVASPFYKVEWYNFQGQSPREAVLDELLD